MLTSLTMYRRLIDFPELTTLSHWPQMDLKKNIKSTSDRPEKKRWIHVVNETAELIYRWNATKHTTHKFVTKIDVFEGVWCAEKSTLIPGHFLFRLWIHWHHINDRSGLSGIWRKLSRYVPLMGDPEFPKKYAFTFLNSSYLQIRWMISFRVSRVMRVSKESIEGI